MSGLEQPLPTTGCFFREGRLFRRCPGFERKCDANASKIYEQQASSESL